MRAQSPLLDDANHDLENNEWRNVLSGRRLKLRDFYINYRVGTISIHMTRKISCTFVNIWEMTGFQSRFLEYDTWLCINLLILNIECDKCR